MLISIACRFYRRMLTQRKHKSSCKVWIEYKGKPLIGKGGAQILEQIEKAESISKAAEKLGMSYRYVWSYLQKIEKAIGEPIIETYRGGKSGGGGAELTKLGKSLLEEYRRVEGYLGEVLSDAEYWEAVGLKISARNRLKGKVLIVEKEGLTAKIKVEITVPAFVTALISREAAEDLGIKVGDEVEAVIKATEVMIAK
jgi:molybdate transport system regulatory protein